MGDLFGYWDHAELWLATIPFALQVVVLVATVVPIAVGLSFVAQWVADVLVRGARSAVAAAGAWASVTPAAGRGRGE